MDLTFTARQHSDSVKTLKGIPKQFEKISMLNAKSMMQTLHSSNVCCVCSDCCSAVKLDFIQAKTDIS